MEQRRTFRLSGIPQGSDEERVKQLSRLAFNWGQDIQMDLKSLAKDPVITEEMVATLEFPEVPEIVDSREVTGHVTDATLSLDTHFHDFTPLSSPNIGTWEIDVVALSGLNGHAFGSFKRKKEPFMWLRDALPRDFPQARVLIYGYDTQILNSLSFQNLLDLGERFRSDLRVVRLDVDKPLILIGHSLGGLLVKEAIHLLATSMMDEDRAIFKSLAGLLFFGVPSQGMDITTLVPMVDGQPNQDLLRNLGPNSPVLRRQSEAFFKAVTRGKFEIVNFFETILSPTAKQKEDGSWEMSGPPALLVTPDSATQGTLPEARTQNFPINSTHSDLVKFPNRRCSPYQAVRWHIQRLSHFSFNSDQHNQEECMGKKGKEEQAKDEEEARRFREGFQKSLAFREQFDREDMLEAASGTCDWIFDHPDFVSWTKSTRGLLWIRGNPGTGKSTMMKKILDRKYEEAVPEKEHCVASYFIHGRGSALQKTPIGLYRSLLHQLYSRIPEAFNQLEHIYRKRNSEVGQHGDKWCWLLGDLKRGLLSGMAEVWAKVSIVIVIDALDEAGEQDATIIADHLKEILEEAVKSKGCVQICFSCRHYPTIILDGGTTICMEHHNAGDIGTFLNTKVGNVSLLEAHERKRLVDYISLRSNGTFQWAVLVLAKARNLRNKGRPFDFILERLQETPTDLNELYQSLLSDLDEPLQTLKLFHWLLFSAVPLSGRQIQHVLALDHDTAKTSIYDYIYGEKFTESPLVETLVINLSKGLAKFSLGADAEEPHECFRGAQSTRCRSTPEVFQLQRHQAVDPARSIVSFIHQSVIEYLLNGGLAAIEIMKSVPCEEIAHFQISRYCLQYLVMDKTGFLTKYIDQLQSEHLGEQHEDKRRFGEATYYGEALSLQSVVTQSDSIDGVRKDLLLDSHDDFDSMDGVQVDLLLYPNDDFDSRDLVRKNLLHHLPLLQYAWTYWLMHYRKAGIVLSHGSSDLLDIFSWPKHDHNLLNTWTRLAWAFATSQPLFMAYGTHLGEEWLCGGLRLPHLLVIVGSWSSTLHTMLANDTSIDAKDEKGETPLSYAVRLGRPTIVKDLLKSSVVNINHQVGGGRSLLHLALNVDDGEISNSALDLRPKTDAHEIMESLVRAHAPLELKDDYGRTPLSYAAGNGHTNVITLLLRSGANVNPRDDLGQTPLFNAAKGGHVNAVRKLLRHGAQLDAKDLTERIAVQHAADNRHAYTALLLLDAYSGSSGQVPYAAFSMLCHAWRGAKSAEEVLDWLKMVRQKKRLQGASILENAQDRILSDGLQYIQQISKRQRVR